MCGFCCRFDCEMLMRGQRTKCLLSRKHHPNEHQEGKRKVSHNGRTTVSASIDATRRVYSDSAKNVSYLKGETWAKVKFSLGGA